MKNVIKSYPELKVALIESAQRYLSDRDGEFALLSWLFSAGLTRARNLIRLAKECDPGTQEGKRRLFALLNALLRTSSTTLVDNLAERLIEGCCVQIAGLSGDKETNTLVSKVLTDEILRQIPLENQLFYCASRSQYAITMVLQKALAMREKINERSEVLFRYHTFSSLVDELGTELAKKASNDIEFKPIHHVPSDNEQEQSSSDGDPDDNSIAITPPSSSDFLTH